MHGGVKFYRGSAGAARSYVEADRSRVGDYYLAEGTRPASRYVAEAEEITPLVPRPENQGPPPVGGGGTGPGPRR